MDKQHACKEKNKKECIGAWQENHKAHISTSAPKSKKRRKGKKQPILPSKREHLGSRAARTSRTSYKMAQKIFEMSTDLTRAATNTLNRAVKSWLSSDLRSFAPAN